MNVEHNGFLTAKQRKSLDNKEKNRKLQEQKIIDRANKKEARAPVGTALGNKQRMQEFKDKLLNAHTGNNIIRKTIEIAMNDEHPGQTTALKMCLDRMLPTSLFEEKKDGSRTAINITISGIGDTNAVIGEVVDNDSSDSNDE